MGNNLKINEMQIIENNPHFGGYWDDFEKEICTPEEIEASKIRADLLIAVSKARKESKQSQKDISKKSKIPQPVISRLENISTDPKLSTVIRLLYSMGKTLKISSL